MRTQNILLFSFLCLGACATSPAVKVTAPIGESQVLISPFVGVEKIKVRRVRVQDPANLHAMVENRRNYRLDFFRQSKDPYFGRDRWSESCLTRNTTGTLLDSSDGKYFRSNATANVSLQTEVCLQDSIDVVQIIGECRAQGLFYEVIAAGVSNATGLKFRCPDEVIF
jgi:hypothetical protein